MKYELKPKTKEIVGPRWHDVGETLLRAAARRVDCCLMDIYIDLRILDDLRATLAPDFDNLIMMRDLGTFHVKLRKGVLDWDTVNGDPMEWECWRVWKENGDIQAQQVELAPIEEEGK